MMPTRMAVRYGMVRWYGTVRLNFCQEVRYAGTVRFFVMVRVRYFGTVCLFCKSTSTVRWYALLVKNPRPFAHCAGFF